MTSVSLEDALSDFADLTRRASEGETIVLTHEGRPVADLVPHQTPDQKRGAIDLEAAEAYLREARIVRRPGFIAPDFDEPLPEDFLLRPLPNT